MGDGRVALILDIRAVVRFADHEAQRQVAGSSGKKDRHTV
jgi:chemotaxis protein histidine kinase CheA